MNYLYIDIETFGCKPERTIEIPELVLPTASDVKVGNVKDPLKLQATIDEKLPQMIAEAKAEHAKMVTKLHDDYDKEWRGNALKSLNLEIIAISFAVNDDEIVNLTGIEEAMLNEMLNILSEKYNISSQQLSTMNIVSHNGKLFDIPIIRHRCIKYGLKSLYSVFNVGRYTERCFDTHEMFAGTDYKSHYSLSKIAAYLGIPSKTIMDGSQVHDFYLRDEIDKIAAYCGEDTDVMRQVFKRLRFE